MKKYIIVLLCFITGGMMNAQSWKLVWADEFNGKILDTAKWNYEVNGKGGGNNELQYYTRNKENIRLEKGKLIIEARKENYLGKEYTSARINTQGKCFWKYGKMEARMKLPYGQGIWPAFWMLGETLSTLGWPSCGEIDIMEMIGSAEGDKRTYSTLHYQGEGGHKQKGGPYTLTTGRFNDDFHVFSTVWNEKEFAFYCDSVPYFKVDITNAEFDEFRANFHILLNLAVGGGWPGNPDSTTVFPQKLEVDYVRVYQLAK
jgi:beta-glucanase (GH16 family)